MSPKERAIIARNDDGPMSRISGRNHRQSTLAGRRPRRKIFVNESAQRIRSGGAS